MSTQNDINLSSLPILHFINTTESTSNQNSRLESLPINDENKIDQHSDIKPSTTNNNNNDDHNEKPIKTVSHSRRVHFPSDVSQLRIISDAPESLLNRPLLSLGVTLQRYRGACQRLQIRPFNCLLDQLSTMDDGRKSFQDRLDCLKIINEKIDLKHIDAIEEILSRCRFYTLDFESSTIDDTALTQLFDVIEYYESCTHINLSNNRSIAFQGYQALAKYLRKTNCLERLDMNSMRFDDNNIGNLVRSLRLSTTLYELHLESCQLNGKILQKFIQNLRSCTSLRELYLCDNRLQVQDSLLINDLIRTCGQFLYLLDLRSNSLQDNGMSHLASQFSQYDEHHTNESNLHKISFQANQLTHQGISFLAKSLLHNRTIHSLNLSNNNITNEGLFALRDALLTNRTINELILRNCRLTDQAAIALAEFIAESSTIQYIDLRENTIQASGICGMAIAIKNNKSLLKLDFDPIGSTPTNFGSLLNTNNIDRIHNSNSLLSLTNLRRMTTGFSSFTGSAPFQSTTSGGGTRELLEQKSRWMNDIAAVCQRNVLIYEENLRLQAEKENNQVIIHANVPTNQQDSTIIKPEDIQLNDQSENNSSLITTDNECLSHNAEISDVEQSKIKETIDDIKLEQETNTAINDDEEIKPSIDISKAKDINVEQPKIHSIDSELNDDNNNQSNNSTFPESSSSISDPTDDINNDDKRKFRHSDSIYLLRKKVKNDNDDNNNNTSDDESQLSSIDEQPIDGI